MREGVQERQGVKQKREARAQGRGHSSPSSDSDVEQ